MTLPAVAGRAAHLRRSLAGRPPGQIAARDAGMLLGDLLRPGQPPGPALYSDWRDTEIDLMGPGAGKTTARAIPLTLAAPGPVVATSNKPDLWAATAALRAQHGPVWLFDPCGICCQQQTFWVDLLSPVTRVESANRLASHFVLTVEDPSKRELWGPAAQTLLSCLFLAASTSGRTLADVAMWLDQPAMPAPAGLLQKAGFGALASSLLGTQNGAPETRDGIFETARTAAKALRDDDVMKWVTPQPGLPAFRPAELLRGTGTLYLLSESLSYAAPLIAAVTDGVLRTGIRLAQMAGGRLDPPVPVVLDECANICRIADLPNLYSYLGSHGLCPVTILQSYEQGEAVWGQTGMSALWGAATCKLVGAGVDSPRMARDLATLVGQHDVPVRSITLGEGRGTSENISLRRQDILEAADIAALGQGLALLLTSGNRPALLRLRNWFTGPDAGRVQAEVDLALRRIQDGAAARGQAGL
jgi:type IV secretory pathway TraG/TraD family ATPase VirD4